jgi:hypothetical protein
MSDNDQDVKLEAEDPALEHEGEVKEPRLCLTEKARSLMMEQTWFVS